MSKKTIQIDKEKCTGCGLCTSACHEGAIGLVDGKATLIHADYCDGLGNCLPVCPTGAISFIDESGNQAARFFKSWPLQMQLVAVSAPFFNNADLLIAADCTAFAYPSFYETFSNGKIVLIGCPKLDEVEYSSKLTEIIKTNNINSVTIIRMEVPCCTGLYNATETALKNSDKALPLDSYIIGIDGNLR